MNAIIDFVLVKDEAPQAHLTGCIYTQVCACMWLSAFWLGMSASNPVIAF